MFDLPIFLLFVLIFIQNCSIRISRNCVISQAKCILLFLLFSHFQQQSIQLSNMLEIASFYIRARSAAAAAAPALVFLGSANFRRHPARRLLDRAVPRQLPSLSQRNGDVGDAYGGEGRAVANRLIPSATYLPPGWACSCRSFGMAASWCSRVIRRTKTSPISPDISLPRAKTALR